MMREDNRSCGKKRSASSSVEWEVDGGGGEDSKDGGDIKRQREWKCSNETRAKWVGIYWWWEWEWEMEKKSRPGRGGGMMKMLECRSYEFAQSLLLFGVQIDSWGWWK